MRGFERMDDGRLSVALEPVEAALLTQLASQVAGLLSEERAEDAPLPAAVRRMLPDAYREDAEASAEFRRFTSVELASRKVQNAQAVIADVSKAVDSDGPVEIQLTMDASGAWVRALTDIRLVLASRLGIEKDGDTGVGDDEAFMLGDVYDWLGWVQDSLVRALDD